LAKTRDEDGNPSRGPVDITPAPLLIGAIGFGLRLWLASRTFLNGDEALHFMAANQPSWQLTYQASLTISHPPLLIFVLHLWRVLGTSETMLRLPSVLAGTAFCWVLFKWVTGSLGRGAGILALILSSFLPSTLALATEIRQYAFLLLWVISALYLFDQAVTQNSQTKMLLSSLCLWLAILSHYSAVLAAAALGAYSLLKLRESRPAPSVVGLWVFGQLGGLLLCLFLYLTYISAFGHRALNQWMDVYLHSSYFHAHSNHALSFVIARTVSVFQYLAGQPAIGDLMFLVFLAGMIFLFRAPSGCGLVAVPKRQLTVLLLLPFALCSIAALFDIYPYGGTRHGAFLLIFALAGVSFGLDRLARRSRYGIAAAIALVIAANVSNGFSAHRFPYMAGADESRSHMTESVKFIRKRIPQNDLLLADTETGLVLGHYLCEQQPFFINVWTTGFKTLNCGGHQVVVTDGRVFLFTASNFLKSWDEMISRYGLSSETVWVLQERWPWENSLVDQLRTRYPQFRDLRAYSFGNNITLFQLKASEAMPAMVRRHQPNQTLDRLAGSPRLGQSTAGSLVSSNNR